MGATCWAFASNKNLGATQMMGLPCTPVPQLTVVASAAGKTLSLAAYFLFSADAYVSVCVCERAVSASESVEKEIAGSWTPAARSSSVIVGLESQVNLLAIYIHTCMKLHGQPGQNPLAGR